MRIAIAHHGVLPAVKYGGIERIVWWLAKHLHKQGHQVTLLALPGSKCDFARVIACPPNESWKAYYPKDIDLIHSFTSEQGPFDKPHLSTFQCNAPPGFQFDRNTVFISRNQAERHGGSVYVYNAIDPDDYGQPDLDSPREHLLFLAKAAWKVKNVTGAISIARRAGRRLAVVGGHRFSLSMGPRLTLDTNVKFHGMLGGEEKNRVIRRSSALLFPVLWQEPFGISLIESLYFGCPVFGTPWGSLRELILPAVGYVWHSESERVEQLANVEAYDRHACHAYVRDCFHVELMVERYLELYERVLAGESLHDTEPVKPNLAEPKRLRMAA